MDYPMPTPLLIPLLLLTLISPVSSLFNASPNVILAPLASTVTFAYEDNSLSVCNYAFQHNGRLLPPTSDITLQYYYSPCFISLTIYVTSRTVGSYSCLGFSQNNTYFNHTVVLLSTPSVAFPPLSPVFLSWLRLLDSYASPPPDNMVRHIQCCIPPCNAIDCRWDSSSMWTPGHYKPPLGRRRRLTFVDPHHKTTALIRTRRLRYPAVLGRSSVSNSMECFQRSPVKKKGTMWRWFRNDSLLTENAQYSITYHFRATTLALRNVQMADYGQYQCEITKMIEGSTTSSRLTLTLFQQPAPHTISLPANHRVPRAIRSLPANEHQPCTYTWTILDFQGRILNTTTNYTRWPWFPQLFMDFAEMGTGVEKFADKALQADRWDKQGSCSPAPADNYRLYFCPAHSTGSSRSACGGVVDRYCRKWSCVSTGHIWWEAPTKNDYIHITHARGQLPCSSWPCCGQRLNPLVITFTTQGQQLSRHQWMTGFTWGGRQWDGDRDEGNIFTIRLSVTMSTYDIGPNSNLKSPFLQKLTTQVNPLVQLVNSSFALLRSTLNDSSKTDQCWLCISDSPPFYDAVASNEPIRNSTSDAECRWNTSSITITDIVGRGCCLGNIPANYSKYCHNVTSGYHCDVYLPPERVELRHGGYGPLYTTLAKGDIKARLKGQYFIPGNNSVWACSTGATACAHGDVLIAQKSFCIQVKLLPKITYYPGPELVNALEPPQFPLRQKREIVTALTLSVLLGLGAAGAATGVSALAVGHQQVAALSLQIDEDLKRIETSISALQTSLSSLAEVALQNRRGLDLLFLNKGGLCVALKEECCFYADHSGIVKDSMAELRKRLKDRENERQQGQSWYQGMFNFSPWLTTLLSALIGPLVLLLLACTIGPCVMGRLLTFLKGRLNILDNEVHNTQKSVSLLTSVIASKDLAKQPLLRWSSDQESEEEADTANSFSPKRILLTLSGHNSGDEDFPSCELVQQGIDKPKGLLPPYGTTLEEKGLYLESGQ